jgi:hypothetical protein
MLRSVKSLYGFSLKALDGIVGQVQEMFFVDDSWNIAYVVVRTGGLVHRRKVLIPPSVFGRPDAALQLLPVALTKDQVIESPGIDSDQPVSSFELMLLREYYEVPAMVGEGNILPSPVLPAPLSEEEEREIAMMQKERNPHLRSTREVSRYHIDIQNGLSGQIDDIVMDDETWRIIYFVTVTGGWFHQRRVFVESKKVAAIRWGEKSVTAELSPGSSGIEPRIRRFSPRISTGESWLDLITTYQELTT